MHDTNTDHQRLSARVTGRVQGVGFRHFTRTTARRQDLTGWVRNEPDGSVRLEAEGPHEDLQALLDAVHEGPRAARVDAVDAEWSDATEDFQQFEVRYA
ncbi:MAG: acylphosphatase [Longimonas sp.]|uniref:acylphosphatase n=1 Tax=Longimonas sp. TaxID=2039626 RepID=UPI003352C9B8